MNLIYLQYLVHLVYLKEKGYFNNHNNSIYYLLFNILLLFILFRALKPKAIDRQPEALPKKCDLMVQIVSARNVPLRIKNNNDNVKSKKNTGFGNNNNNNNNRSRSRRSGSGGGGDDDNNQENENLLDNDFDDDIMQDRKRVNTFVEVTFQEKKVRTTSIEGPAPAWKQSLSLPFNPPHGEFNHATLEQVTDIVTFTLFDEIIFDDAQRGGFLDGENTKREERFYLGKNKYYFCLIILFIIFVL